MFLLALLLTFTPEADSAAVELPDSALATLLQSRDEQVAAVNQVIETGDKRRIMTELQSMADGGNGYAAWQLGVFFDTGQHDIPVDPQRAFGLFERAVQAGETAALVSLGLMHALGRGTPVDYAASMRSYSAAAAAGEAHGYYGIGVLYALGQGVAQDDARSLPYFMVAAAMGDEEAVRPMILTAAMLSPEKVADAVRDANIMLEAAAIPLLIKHDEQGFSVEPKPAVDSTKA